MFLNGKSITEYGASLVRNYTVSGMAVDTEVEQGYNRTSYTLASQQLELKTIKIDIVFLGENTRDLFEKKSLFDASCLGIVELYLPDGFYYTAYLKTVGTLKVKADTMGEASYQFKGIQHDPLIKAEKATFFAYGTAPKMDARIIVTASADSDAYTVGSGVFTGIRAGDVIVFDGINKIITINGNHAAAQCTFLNFPQVVPGENTIECPDVPTVEYFPVWV